MRTFKDTVILRKGRDGKLTICDFDYSPTSKQEEIVLPLLKEFGNDLETLETKINEKQLYIVVVDENFINDNKKYSPNLFETLENIKTNFDFGADLFDDDDGEGEDEKGSGMEIKEEYSNMKTELLMRRKYRNKIESEYKNKFKFFDGEEIIYLKGPAKFARPKLGQQLYKKGEIMMTYNIDGKMLQKLIDDGTIKFYENIEYVKSNKLNYEKLDHSTIIQPIRLEGKKYKIPEKIEFLLKNLTNNNEDSFNHLNQLILWKLRNLNSPNLPAVVFLGNGGAGKGLLLVLLEGIFGYQNVNQNIQQDTISGQFGFTGEHLVAEFAEISTHNVHTDKLMGNKLKNLIGSNEFEVNKKGIQKYKTKNVTWFLISSNDLKPLQLDVGTGNRRYSIIKVGPKIEPILGKEIEEAVRNEKTILQYVNWLEQEYSENLPKVISSLENEDKKDLENRAMNEVRMFWSYIKEEYNPGTKILAIDIGEKFSKFCRDNDIAEKDYKKYLWTDSPFTRKTIDIGGKKCLGIII